MTNRELDVQFFEPLQRTDEGGLYQHISTSQTWVGYLVPQKDAPEEGISFSDSWTKFPGNPIGGVNGGCYLFAEQPPVNPSKFISELLALLREFNQNNLRAYRYFFWFEKTETGEVQTLTPQYIPFFYDPNSQQAQVTSLATVSLRNIKIQLAELLSINIDEENQEFQFQQFATTNVQLFNKIGVQQPVGKIDGNMSLPIGGDSPGTLEFKLLLTTAGAKLQNDFITLGLGIKYFFINSQNELSSQLYPVIGYAPQNPQIPFECRFDPLHPTDGNLTYFSFVNIDETTPPTTFTSYFRTDFQHKLSLTPLAQKSSLVLAGDKSRRETTGGKQIDTYYLVPNGQFVMALDDTITTAEMGETNEVLHLLCGLSGTETISLQPSNGSPVKNIVTFYPGQAAFAPVFPLKQTSLRDTVSQPEQQPLLTGEYTTSWMTIETENSSNISSSANVYFSQPPGAPLYANGEGAALSTEAREGNGNDANFLGFFQLGTTQLTPTGIELSYPVVPYANATLDLENDGFTAQEIVDFEQQLISKTRKTQIRKIQQQFPQVFTRFAGNESKPSTTPQGFLVDVELNGSWSRLLLAQNTVLDSQGNRTSYYLQFNNLSESLQNAFQTNQQFLVVTAPQTPWTHAANTNPPTDPDPTQATFNNLISIEDWPLEINVDTNNSYGNYSNVLIFKFCEGSLLDKIKNPKTWTNAEDFNHTENNELIAISQWLQDYITDAENQNSSFFENFLNIVKSPNWNGILALKVDINLAQFPAELKGLLAGIDLNQFNAHHFGIDVNYVTSTPTSIGATSKSSLFGLINYLDPAYVQQVLSGGDPDQPIGGQTTGVYDFKVLTLQVLFANSEIKTFSSRTQLTVNQWFGDRVTQVTNDRGGVPSNSIMLNGSYENHNGIPTYTFNTIRDNKFWLNSNVLYNVEIIKAQFNTLTNQQGTESQAVESRFILWGYFNYAALKEFDAFSFGSSSPPSPEKNETQVGLNFANLYIDMDFDLSIPTLKTFTFNPAQISFNIDGSTPRQHSLFHNFPLKFKNLVMGEAGKKPTEQGFLAINVQMETTKDGKTQVTPFPAKGLGDTWFGLEFELKLGTAGALAAEAGLTANLLMAWSPLNLGQIPDDKAYNVFFGIKLPGAGGGQSKLLSLQGVLKLSINDIMLIFLPESQAYLLKFTNIALKFLSLKFPPGGNTLFMLFGNPDPNAPNSSLGWYAAYNQEEKK